MRINILRQCSNFRTIMHIFKVTHMLFNSVNLVLFLSPEHLIYRVVTVKFIRSLWLFINNLLSRQPVGESVDTNVDTLSKPKRKQTNPVCKFGLSDGFNVVSI